MIMKVLYKYDEKSSQGQTKDFSRTKDFYYMSLELLLDNFN